MIELPFTIPLPMLEHLSANAVLMVFAVMIPLFGAVLLPFFSRQPNTRDAISLLTGVALLFVVLQLLDVFNAGSRPFADVWELMPDFHLTFRLRPLGLVFALVASSLWIVTTLYGIGYMRGNKELHQTRFFTCFAIAIAATMGIAFSADLLTLFICYEVLSLSTYPLVTHKGDENARRGGRVYLGILMGASLGLLLPAIIVIWHVTGRLNFSIGGLVNGYFTPWQTGLLLAALVFGLAKSALMPLHRWLPSAMVAPTPVSALLHAVAVVKAGVFSVVMVIVYIFGFETLATITRTHWEAGSWLTYIACFTIIASSLVALRQDNLKARLAYSTIGQLSYVILGAALLSPLSLVGAAVHIVAHAFGKITLFFAAGAIYTASKKTRVSELGGIGRMMPWTMTAFTLGALSIIGVPPTIGFISKWYIFLGAMDTHHIIAVITLIISTLLNAAYLLPIIVSAFFGSAPEDSQPHGEAPRLMIWAMLLTAGATVILFFCSDGLLRIVGEIPSQWEPMHLL